MDVIISLRQYIDNRDQIDSIKVKTFCRLMRMVSDAIEKEDRNIIKINLDDIKINTVTGEIVFPDNVIEDMDKTISGYNTGVSIMSERKSSKEHKRISLALMILGWYANPDGSAVTSDMQVIENFDYYMSKVPTWLQGFFVGVFRNMDYTTTFSDYYKTHFEGKIKNDIKESFKDYNLTDDQFSRICSLVAKITNRMIREGEVGENG